MIETAPVCHPLPPLAAYAHDFPGRTPERGNEALSAWLQAALVLWRLGQLPGSERAAALEDAARVLHAADEATALDTFGRDHSPLAAVLADVAHEPDAVDAWGARLARTVREGAEQLERAGAFRLAYSLLSALRDAVRELAPADAGLIIVQQGRIAREIGATQTAQDHYLLAERLGVAAGDDFVICKARLGRGILVATRGNYPAARTLFRKALAGARRLGNLQLEATAHNGLLMAAVAAKDVDAALTHGWAVYRCAAGAPERQAEVLVNLAEVALLAGHPESALSASLEAVRLTAVDRVQLAGYGTAAVAAARLGRRDILDRVARESVVLIDQSHQHVDRAFTSVELAEAYAALAIDDAARAFLARAREIAEPRQYFEVLYRADGLAGKLAGSRAPAAMPAVRGAAEIGSDASESSAAPVLSATSRTVIRTLAALRS